MSEQRPPLTGAPEPVVLIPKNFVIDASCYEDDRLQAAVARTTKELLHGAAACGFDLTALDGVTYAWDCRAKATAMQEIPKGQVPLEMTDTPETMELARTVLVRRDGGVRFHIVARAGVGVMTIATDAEQARLARACIAHEAAHVDHEGNLYARFPEILGGPLECGNRSRQSFLKAMDVWSEYAACRSAGLFRPEAVQEFESAFCQSLQRTPADCLKRISQFREDGNAAQAFQDIQQMFGDLFICAGYLLGHLDGLEFALSERTPKAAALLQKHPRMADTMERLRRTLNHLWLSEFAWTSIEVFAPIYDLVVECIAFHGMAFEQRGDEWRILMCEDEDNAKDLRHALDEWLRNAN